MPASQARAKFDRYRASLAMLERELADTHLVELLRFEIEALEQLPPQPAPSDKPARARKPSGQPARATEQRHEALALANVARGQRAVLKRGITDGTVTLRGLLDAPSAPAADCTLAELLQSQAGWGPRRTQRFLTRHEIAELRRLGELTARQRSTMATDFA